MAGGVQAPSGDSGPSADNEADSQSAEVPIRPADELESNQSGDPQAANQERDATVTSTQETLLYRTPRRRKRIVFTDAQLQSLESFFKNKQYANFMERSELAKCLLLPEPRIQVWFQNRRAKEKREKANLIKTALQRTAMQRQKDLLRKQKIEATIKWVRAQRRINLRIFPPPRPMGFYPSPQVLNESGVVNQNVDGPPSSFPRAEVYNMTLVISNEAMDMRRGSNNKPNAMVFNQFPPNRIIVPGMNIGVPESSITDLTSYDGPSTSSAPVPSQMLTACDYSNNQSSTDSAPEIYDWITDSDQENHSPPTI